MRSPSPSGRTCRPRRDPTIDRLAGLAKCRGLSSTTYRVLPATVKNPRSQRRQCCGRPMIRGRGGCGRGQRFPIVPRHPALRVGWQRVRVTIEFGQVIESIRPAQFARVNQAHKQIPQPTTKTTTAFISGGRRITRIREKWKERFAAISGTVPIFVRRKRDCPPCRRNRPRQSAGSTDRHVGAACVASGLPAENRTCN